MSQWRAGGAGSVLCPACDEVVHADDRFCEGCGAPLQQLTRTSTGASADAPVPSPVEQENLVTCASCGPPVTIGPDGYCLRCGRHESALSDHRVLVDGPLAAVTGPGTTHWRNEDAVAVRWVDGDPGGFVMVVCDGVSRSQEPHIVSQAAVDTALLVLSGAVSAGGDLDAAMVEAAAAAQRAAAAVPYDPDGDLGPGACTFVAAAARGTRAAFASVGDSRAYWVDAEGALQIGRDDSLAAELVASGRLTVHQAMASAGAHALTKWLGVDATDVSPSVISVDLPGPGLVVLASDGLWNYAPEPDDLARLIGPLGREGSLDLARRLATFAEEAGGADNITVAVAPHDLQGVG